MNTLRYAFPLSTFIMKTTFSKNVLNYQFVEKNIDNVEALIDKTVKRSNVLMTLPGIQNLVAGNLEGMNTTKLQNSCPIIMKFMNP